MSELLAGASRWAQDRSRSGVFSGGEPGDKRLTDEDALRCGPGQIGIFKSADTKYLAEKMLEESNETGNRDERLSSLAFVTF